jgi:DNA recombination protein RmuC
MSTELFGELLMVFVGLVSMILGGSVVFFLSKRQSTATARTIQNEMMLRARAEEKAIHTDTLAQKVDLLQQETSHLQSRNMELSTLLHKERSLMKEKEDLLLKAEITMREAFQSLSAEALKSNNQAFLSLAKNSLEKFQETAQTDLKSRQEAIKELITPVKEALGSVDKKIQDMEKIRLGAYEGLKQQVTDLLTTQKDLRAETQNLVNALRAPNVRGRWGEMQLKRVVEMAGMLAHCDFEEQSSQDDAEGRLRPDMVVRLPNDKHIVVDAKTPLYAYLEALEEKDITQKTLKLKLHAKQVRTHIMALGAKSYWTKFESSPEFVVMFLPGETFFSAALEQDPSLIELGAEQKVILATPTTLIALLRAVSYGWRQEQIANNAKEISALGQELYKRLSDVSKHIARIGRNLEGAVDSYNQAIGTLEHRVFVSARKFQELGATSHTKEIEPLEPIDKQPRVLTEK